MPNVSTGRRPTAYVDILWGEMLQRNTSAPMLKQPDDLPLRPGRIGRGVLAERIGREHNYLSVCVNTNVPLSPNSYVRNR